MQRNKKLSGPVIAVACYKPRSGKSKQLLKCVKDHLPILRSQKLVTPRKSIAMQSTNGTIVEIFEWKSAKSINDAHRNPAVLKLWERYDACCTFVQYSGLPEAKERFANFSPL